MTEGGLKAMLATVTDAPARASAAPEGTTSGRGERGGSSNGETGARS